VGQENARAIPRGMLTELVSNAVKYSPSQTHSIAPTRACGAAYVGGLPANLMDGMGTPAVGYRIKTPRSRKYMCTPMPDGVSLSLELPDNTEVAIADAIRPLCARV
jgi:hypothetical protein